MYSGQTIVLKNLRQVPPNTAKVIQLQRQLIEAVQRYQELITKSNKDEADLQKLLKEIATIDQQQREELNLVREAELNYSASLEAQNSLSSTASSVCDSVNENSENGSGSEDERSIHQEEESRETYPSPSAVDEQAEESDSALEGNDREIEQTDEAPMDWEDLTREQWTESDRLLQKIERVGSKMLQRDFMSCVDLVHVSEYKNAEEGLALRKLRDIKGKKVITTGPWQMIDIPTKVTNRRCNYLTGLHVTVRQKDPKRSANPNTGIETAGVKTRHHDSRGSSRTSSRASSPISQMDCFNKESNVLGNVVKLRSVKTRGIKAKKIVLASKPINNNNNHAKPSTLGKNPASSSEQSISKPEISSSGFSCTKNPSRTLEPCVTYTVVDGVPHFKVFFPSSKDSIVSPAAGTVPKVAKPTSPFSPHASVVESDIEIHANISGDNSSTPLSTSPDRKIKSSVKPVKRPRLSQPTCSPPSTSPKSVSSNSSAETVTSVQLEDTTNKEELGRCMEKCGSWMGAPHFKIYRTFPSTTTTTASSVADWSPSSTPPIMSTTPIKPVVLSPAPKLSPSVSTPKLAIAPNKSNNLGTPLPAMPKLTIGNQPIKNVSPNMTSLPPTTQGGKFVPIAPKITNLSTNVSNIVIVPLNDKNQTNSPTGVKRPISLLKACTPLNSSQNPAATGTFLTVKNLKECLQNNKQYKDMKVVVQKVPVPTTTSGSGHIATQPTPVQRLPLADTEDLKKKVVKLFPSTNSDVKDQSKTDENPPVPPATVIVADMSI